MSPRSRRRGTNFTIATPLPGTDLYAQAVRAHPELADRRAVSHAAFSLFTALTPTRLEPRRFYERVAALYRSSHQARLRPEIVRQGVATLQQSPWLIPRLVRIPTRLRSLTKAAAFLQAHGLVQGRRLLDSAGPVAGRWMVVPEE